MIPRKCRLQIVGMGPAGLGLLVAADRHQKLQELLLTNPKGSSFSFSSSGCVVIDACSIEQMGAGALPRYEINSNSFATDFTDLVGQAGIFKGLWEDPNSSLRKIHAYGKNKCPLPMVADLQKELASVVIKELQKKDHGNCAVLANTRVARLEMAVDKTSNQVVWYSFDQGGNLIAESDHLLLSVGAQQSLLNNLASSFFRLPLSDHEEWVTKTHLSDDLLTAEKVDKILKKHQKDFKMAILGASHSAFSIAWKFVTRAKTLGIALEKGAIKMIYRNSIHIYYPSVQDAIQQGFKSFDPVDDVCPVTGAVHRFGGLREDARRLYESIGKGLEDSISLLDFTEATEKHQSDFNLVMDESKLIVQAFGYQCKSIPISKRENKSIEPISLVKRPNGQVLVDNNGNVFMESEAHRTVIPGLLVAGLGYGFMASEKCGGEPSFRKQGKSIDGINMYQGTVGSVLLNHMFPSLKAKSSECEGEL